MEKEKMITIDEREIIQNIPVKGCVLKCHLMYFTASGSNNLTENF